MKFRKKSIVIEAIKCLDVLKKADRAWMKLPSWLRQSYERGEIVFGDTRVYINTLEGKMIAEKDDWIICGIKGELYPCKPDIFEATYEPVASEGKG